MANNATGVFTSSLATSGPASISFTSPSSIAVPLVITTSQPQSTVEAPSQSISSQLVPSISSPTPVVVVSSVATSSVVVKDGRTSLGPVTVLLTSVIPAQVTPTNTVPLSSSASASSTKSGSAALATSGSSNGTSSGLSPGGTIAIAVVVPVVAVALLVLAGLFLWRKRKQRKEEEDLRRKEVEDYGFNPNHDQTLAVVGAASSNEDEMTQVDGAGYRGWGTTSTNRKPSTTLSSGNGAAGVTRSTSGSENGRFGQSSPTAATNKSSDMASGDPLVGSPPNGRPLTADSETIGALGAVPSNGNQPNMHRGPSNASSAYSGAHRSDSSADGPTIGNVPGQQLYSEGMYYDEGMPQHGPYGDGSYGGGQPVVRDVPARRNTRIENPSVIPQQGSSGIAQNF